ncbi:carboxypeptidase-like regulatory domain-containing protein [Maribacter halichondriae]|uniref:carboxypeptidase-like regulatory domain-containing protein n=1 Tax=Maribacter halichondriae TaxID=2980554 RepID=UPI00235866EA|nr:carboxypeptidase-like regulatory domain-containing protein [Maribacter sp. Hal144]
MRNIAIIVLILLILNSCRTLPKRGDGNVFTVNKSSTGATLRADIYGKIIEKNDRYGLGAANIELISIKNSYVQTSDKGGNFKFQNIPSGKYLIRTEYVGLFSFRDSITVGVTEKVELVIELGSGY